MKAKHILLTVLILFFGGVAFYSMSDMMTPYVSFDQARNSGQYVQVIGTLVKSKPVQHDEGSFSFFMEDEQGSRLNVVHTGTKPLNFDHATQVVALGNYNSGTQTFDADRLLVKCPSKYTRENK